MPSKGNKDKDTTGVTNDKQILERPKLPRTIVGGVAYERIKPVPELQRE